MTSLHETLSSGLFVIAGPCVLESRDLAMGIAESVADIGEKLSLPVIFKGSFDKANRTSLESYRGPGIDKGLAILQDVKDAFGIPVTTDVHESHQAAPVGEVCDILQIPAFLCRQTDLLVESAKTGKIVNIKKAQFLSGADMKYPVEKVRGSGNSQVMLTERGTSFGYNNLVVDFRNIPDMCAHGVPVIMDATHSVQRPGGQGGTSGGNREFVPAMAASALAFGATGLFFEVHPDPDNAKSDGPNMVPLSRFGDLLRQLMAVRDASRGLIEQ